MTTSPDIVCIGSVLWDIIGRSPASMHHGADVPGRIVRLPGGVALNIAATLARFDLRPALLSVVGRDADGDALVTACAAMGLETGFLYRSDDLPTDRYMAIEGAGGLVAAIADAHSLEAAGDKILRPLIDGPLGSRATPFTGTVALDGNLTAGILGQIAISPAFAVADLRVAPASPGKAERLLPFLRAGSGVLYVNLEEAGLLLQTRFPDAGRAAAALIDHGAARVVVTDGGRICCDASRDGVFEAAPPQVLVARVTGAGDTFMAAHIAAERAGEKRQAALERALSVAASYVSGDVEA
jgi:sugar/nucleoside kinase (ribokinase family)